VSTPLLNRYREAGYTLIREGNTLRVACEHGLTERMRQVFRARKAELFRELAIEAAKLDEYRTTLERSRLHLCGNCASFTYGPDPGGVGTCSKFGEGLMPFAAPFWCSGFTASETPAVPEFLPIPMERP
jgi:hypothetical protein